MPRLSRHDAWRVVEALQRLEVLDPEAAARLEVARVLGRLIQRAVQASGQTMPASSSNPNTSRPARGHLAIRSPLSVQDVEEGHELAPQYDADGLIPCITTDAVSGEVLMLGWMNADALRLTVATGEAHYWSRSRQVLWHKGATSGMVHQVVEIRIDDDQDAVWLRVNVQGLGASCHVGYRSCFYRCVPLGKEAGKPLAFTETHKAFEPSEIYGDVSNPGRQ